MNEHRNPEHPDHMREEGSRPAPEHDGLVPLDALPPPERLSASTGCRWPYLDKVGLTAPTGSTCEGGSS